MKSVFEEIVASLLDGIDRLAFGTGDTEQFLASLLSSTSAYNPVPDYKEAKQRFERASTYAYMLLNSNQHKNPVNGTTVLAHLRHLASIVDIPTKWCKSVLEAESATDEEKDLALSTYDSFVVGVGSLIEVIKGIREGSIQVSWLDNKDPGDLPDIPLPATLNK